mmetsp:Transcript_3049/g.6988  ORF Transcript_3049/g.6988 Transcript_3049/m.6988 type:complete len:87 (-) Transcript_3049:254-514(-)
MRPAGVGAKAEGEARQQKEGRVQQMEVDWGEEAAGEEDEAPCSSTPSSIDGDLAKKVRSMSMDGSPKAPRIGVKFGIFKRKNVRGF